MVEVRLAAPLRPIVGGVQAVNADGRNLREVLNNLGTNYPGFRDRVLEPDGNIKPSIYIFLNAEDIGFLKGTETPVEDGDVVMILPAVAGG